MSLRAQVGVSNFGWRFFSWCAIFTSILLAACVYYQHKKCTMMTEVSYEQSRSQFYVYTEC